ncbi:MAG: hypothetical protein EP330_19700 [Deltaproteobacteria bacterium]|nr:MAG: hypothetical protein EP330_19700 [Deltaproteobacteria bacterium]
MTDEAFSPPDSERIPSPWLVFLAPFYPPAWRAAAEHVLPFAMLQLVVWVSVFACLSPGVLDMLEPIDWDTLATDFDAEADPIVLERGEVYVEGPRLFHYEDANTNFLVDPDETVPLHTLSGPDVIVIRRTEIVRQRMFGTQYTSIAELQDTFGVPDMRIDGPGIRRFGEQWGARVRLGFALFLGVIVASMDFMSAGVYAAIAAMVLAGMRRAPPMRALRASLAVSSSTVLLGGLLRLVGLVTLPCCSGFLVYPMLIALGTAWATDR